MKKKTYEQPQMTVVNLEQMDIICTSGEASFSLQNGVVEQGDNGDWGDTNLNW